MSGELAFGFLAAGLWPAKRLGITDATTSRVGKDVLCVAFAIGLDAFDWGDGCDGRENTGGGEVNDFLADLLTHVCES